MATNFTNAPVIFILIFVCFLVPSEADVSLEKKFLYKAFVGATHTCHYCSRFLYKNKEFQPDCKKNNPIDPAPKQFQEDIPWCFSSRTLRFPSCPHTSDPDNGHLESNQSDQSNQSDRYRNMVYAKQKLMCNHGYIASTATITCTGNLTWSPTVVTCNPTFSTGKPVENVSRYLSTVGNGGTISESTQSGYDYTAIYIVVGVLPAICAGIIIAVYWYCRKIRQQKRRRDRRQSPTDIEIESQHMIPAQTGQTASPPGSTTGNSETDSGQGNGYEDQIAPAASDKAASFAVIGESLCGGTEDSDVAVKTAINKKFTADGPQADAIKQCTKDITELEYCCVELCYELLDPGSTENNNWRKLAADLLSYNHSKLECIEYRHKSATQCPTDLIMTTMGQHGLKIGNLVHWCAIRHRIDVINEIKQHHKDCEFCKQYY